MRSTSCPRSTSRRASPRTTSRTATLDSPGMRRATATSSSTAGRRISPAGLNATLAQMEKSGQWAQRPESSRSAGRDACGHDPAPHEPKAGLLTGTKAACEPEPVKREGAASPGEARARGSGRPRPPWPPPARPRAVRPTLIEVVGLGKDFGRHASSRTSTSRSQSGREGLHRRPEWVGQDDSAPLPQPADRAAAAASFCIGAS